MEFSKRKYTLSNLRDLWTLTCQTTYIDSRKLCMVSNKLQELGMKDSLKFLLDHHFDRGSVDKTLFIKKQNGHILIAQIYVDDIIFGSTSEEMSHGFAQTMKSEFEMSMEGELRFFLGLQMKQTNDDIFLSQTKFAKDLVSKFGLQESKPASTPISTSDKITKDLEGAEVDSTYYRSIIGSLLYLTASRLDIAFSVGACARYQAAPKESHLKAATKRCM